MSSILDLLSSDAAIPRADELLDDATISEHVANIQVPDTFRPASALAPAPEPEPSKPATPSTDRRRAPSTDRRPASSGGVLPKAKTLTLKEQNAKLDQLNNENLNLKLKIHFLDDALHKRSDDGVAELIELKVKLQTELVNARKESLTLRRKIKDLQHKVDELQESLADAKQPKNEDDDDPTFSAQMHEEILFLRQKLDHSENEVTTLKEQITTKEFEKRKMAEKVRSMATHRGEVNAGMKETVDLWQGLLNEETEGREAAEAHASELQDELNAIKLEQATKLRNNASPAERRRSRQGTFHTPDDTTDEFMRAAEESEYKVLVDELKQTNENLRRDLGAQTSMLTSKNRNIERLQTEIEGLKLLTHRGAQSVAGDSIFERSISRAHQRSHSRASDHTQVTEAERDEWDKKEGQLRDTNAELRIKHQELDRTHKKYMEFVSTLEGDYANMEDELDETRDALQKLQVERDDTLKAYEELETEYSALKDEALAELRALDRDNNAFKDERDEAYADLEKTSQKLQAKTNDYNSLQNELRQITDSVMNLENLKQHNMRTIATLEAQLTDAEEETQKWEQKCTEIDQKNRKLEITEESLHNEVTFLREEQEGDKIKIGELEDALNASQQQIHDANEKLRELEASITDERHQRDVLENKSKEEVQKILDDLNTENTKIKDEVRKLRRALSAKEIEANSFKQKLDELEQDLRRILGSKNGTKPSLLADIERLQREMATTSSELDKTKMDLTDKDRLLRHRDGLLENSSLESRRLSDLLDKERSSRKHELDQLEKASRGQASHIRTIARHESRVLELETFYTQEQRKVATLEQQYREHLHERNDLLLALWNRLSTLCGQDWRHNHALLDGEQPSIEVISRHLPSFNQNIVAAVQTLEGVIGSFKVRIRSIEKDLWRDYQTIQHNLDMRISRMDILEADVRNTQRSLAEEQQRPQATRSNSVRTTKGSEEIGKLKTEVKLLKAELKFHRQHPSAMAQQMINQQAQMNPESARRQSTSQSPARQIVNTLLRHTSSSAVEQVETENNRPQTITLSSPMEQPNEQRWVHRLRELERRLKAEREARLLDRKGARQRLEQSGVENGELRRMLERHTATQEEIARSEEDEE